jgi:hypothetical protein
MVFLLFILSATNFIPYIRDQDLSEKAKQIKEILPEKAK